MWVTFDMLERPPHYDDVAVGDKQSSLRTAMNLLKTAFLRRSLVFIVPIGSGTVVGMAVL